MRSQEDVYKDHKDASNRIVWEIKGAPRFMFECGRLQNEKEGNRRERARKKGVEALH